MGDFDSYEVSAGEMVHRFRAQARIAMFAGDAGLSLLDLASIDGTIGKIRRPKENPERI